MKTTTTLRLTPDEVDLAIRNYVACYTPYDLVELLEVFLIEDKQSGKCGAVVNLTEIEVRL